MNRQKWTILIIALVLMGGTASLLVWLRTHSKLGKPGIQAAAISGSPRMNLYLPESVLDYSSFRFPPDDQLLNGLPRDTSIAQGRYTAPDGYWILLNVVLMGTDRTSIHKPQFCLTGIGWNIDAVESSKTTIRMEHPHSYDLPVMKLTASKDVNINGQQVKARGVYVYWFVADDQVTEAHGSRMWRMALNFLSTGQIQRWAYISCFSVCNPGDEEATYERMKRFITASVPKFQLAAGPRITVPTASDTVSR
jgi:hypothetical protein